MFIIRGIHKLSDILDKIAEIVIVLMLGAMVLITGAQIVCRIFFTALAWSEEATRYLLIWSTLLGAGCVYKHSGHISISVLQDNLPSKAKDILKIIIHLLCIVLFTLIMFYGIQYFGKQGNQLSAAMRLPMRYVYTCIPLGCGVMLFHALDAVLNCVMHLLGKEEA
ncbi:TRAP transporter small permease [Hominifimenecus sp. rT4P-3]|uniref:TRAP transporter small permease n=1 Tax=Hominifimenecus sp. rT4P-3 TaxID=3242979 RepID=UPI003DA634B3